MRCNACAFLAILDTRCCSTDWESACAALVPKDFDGFGFGVSSTVREEEGLGSVFLMLYAARATSQAYVH